MRWESDVAVIGTELTADCADFTDGNKAVFSWVQRAARSPPQHLRHPRYPWLALRLDCDLGLDRIGNETLLVRHVTHFLDLLRRWLVIAGEFEPGS